MLQGLLQALFIMFREGLESFLIIGVIVTFLRKTGRERLVRGVHLGIGASVIACTGGAWLWYRTVNSGESNLNQSLYEGIAALVAALLVGALLFQMTRLGKRLKGDIEERLQRAAGSEERPSWKAVLAVAAVTTVLITREGLEAVLFLGVQAFYARKIPMTIGAILGFVAAGALAWSWSRFGHKLQMGIVLRVTAIFLALFLVQLVIYGVHELAESGVIQGSQGFHDATERFGPDGDIGQALIYALVGAPLLYLLLARRRRKSSGPVSPIKHPSVP